MTPFYLFFGVLIIYIFQSRINLNKLKGFASIFLILFIFSPFAYAYVSIIQTDKRTDYPGKEVAKEVQEHWDDENWINKIEFIAGDEWHAGNLSYHLKSRPKWYNNFENQEVTYLINHGGGIILVGDDNTFPKEKCITGSYYVSPDSVLVKNFCMIGMK